MPRLTDGELRDSERRRHMARTLAAVVLIVWGIAAANARTGIVPECGNTPGTTAGSYSGLVTLTVSGLIDVTPGDPLRDGFYKASSNDPSMSLGPDPTFFRYNRASEGTCLCSSE